ncbi:MAG: hypothetical protein ABID84_05335 [Chloroflexota bacterium]
MLPKWTTPERQRHLVALFQQSGGFCVHGHRPCPFVEHHYEVYIEGLIDDWQASDREEDAEAWQQERRRLHWTNEPWGKPRSRFDSVAREKFLLDRPDYYLEGVGYDALVGQPVAQARIAGTYVRLFVRLPHNVVKLKLGKRWKVVHHYCNLAVRDWKKQKRMI